MYKILVVVVLFIFVLSSYSYATQKVYYDSIGNKTIIDVSGQKPKEQIIAEFGQADYQVVDIDENNEAIRVESGKLVKYNYKEENEKIRQEKEKIKKQKEIEVKQKLNLSDKELQDLREVLK